MNEIEKPNPSRIETIRGVIVYVLAALSTILTFPLVIALPKRWSLLLIAIMVVLVVAALYLSEKFHSSERVLTTPNKEILKNSNIS